MSSDTHSAKAKVTSDGPSDTPAEPEQSDTQKTPVVKDIRTMFKEARELAFNSTREENLARFPILKEFTPRSVSPATAMRVLEELEREERELPGPPEPTGAGNAS